MGCARGLTFDSTLAHTTAAHFARGSLEVPLSDHQYEERHCVSSFMNASVCQEKDVHFTVVLGRLRPVTEKIAALLCTAPNVSAK